MVDREIRELVEKLRETDTIKKAILRHLERQDGVQLNYIRWDDESLHRLGEETADDEC